MKKKLTFMEKWINQSGFSMYPIEREFMNQLIEDTPSFRKALDNDITDKYYADGTERLTGKISNSWKNLFIGKPGSGKSWSALYIYVFEQETMGSEINIEKHFGFDKTTCQAKLAAIIQEFTGKDITAFLISGKLVRIRTSMNQDEDTVPHGAGSNVEKDVQLNIEKTTRQAQINWNFCSPTLAEHIYDCIIRIFAINSELNQTIGFLINPDNFRPIGVVTFGLPSDKIIGQYEKEKNKYLIKAGKGEFAGNRGIIKRQIVDQLLAEDYDIESVRKLIGVGTLGECEDMRQEMMIIEQVAAGRVSINEQKDIFEIITIEEPELDFRNKKKKGEDKDE